MGNTFRKYAVELVPAEVTGDISRLNLSGYKLFDNVYILKPTKSMQGKGISIIEIGHDTIYELMKELSKRDWQPDLYQWESDAGIREVKLVKRNSILVIGTNYIKLITPKRGFKKVLNEIIEALRVCLKRNARKTTYII